METYILKEDYCLADGTYLSTNTKVKGILNISKTLLAIEGKGGQSIPISYLSKYTKQFTLEQLYQPNTLVVPENAEQASELLAWFETTGKSKYIQTKQDNPNYIYSITYYYLHDSSRGNLTKVTDPIYKIIKWSDIPDAINKQPIADYPSSLDNNTSQNTIKDLSMSSTITVWINPKPNKPNTQPISVGSFCLANNHPFPLTCTEIRGNYYYLKQPNGDVVVFDNSKEIYPLTELKQTGYKVGDILNIDDTWRVYTGDSSVPLGYKSYRPNYPVNGSEALVQNLIKFSCGTLICSTTKQVVVDTSPKTQTVITESSIPYEHFQIKEYYSIDKVQAKDEELFKELQITLDHPLNIESKEFALLVGPSGSGKTELAIQYANSRNLPYVKMQITSQTTVDDYIGYKSITTGKYFPSLLREAVEKGYTLILDEIDAGNPNSTLVLNGLKQSHFQFPDKLVQIHPNFRVIATANTLEYSEQYNSRMPMDKATLDRFHIIYYDMKDHHLAIRYGFDYIKLINTKDKTPRQIEREVRQLKIHEELKQTNYYD